jgi:phage-related protein
MIENAKYFNYNNIDLSSFGDMRIGTESNDLYGVQIIGERVLFEEKIPGRKAPYFYGIDDTPLTLNITVALERPKPISELREFLRWLYNVKEYKQLWFDSDPNKFYYAIFIGSPTLRYIDRSTSSDISANNRKLIGFITLTARCNTGTAFGPAVSTTVTNAQIYNTFSIVNNGDDVAFPSLVLKMSNTALPAGNSFLKLKVENLTNNSVIEFDKVYRNEEITLDMSIRRLSNKDGTTAHNIYES